MVIKITIISGLNSELYIGNDTTRYIIYFDIIK